MKIGRLIRDEMLWTTVANKSKCYSSCVIAFVGGVFRVASLDMGIHSFYSKEFIGSDNFSETSRRYNQVADEIREYLREMRIPVSLLDDMMSVSHKNLKILNLEEIKKYSLIGVDPVYSQVMDKNGAARHQRKEEPTISDRNEPKLCSKIKEGYKGWCLED